MIQKLFQIGLFSLLSLTPFLQPLSQDFSEAEIEQAVEMMRASGQSEEQIKQFLDAVDMAKSISIPTLPAEASGNQASDIQSVTGFSDQDMAVVAPIAGAIKQNQNDWMDEKLKEQVAAFETRYADRPDVFVTFGDEQIKMKLLDCSLDDAYRFSAQGAPRKYSESGPVAGLSRGWSVSSGSWKAAVSISIDGIRYNSDLPTGDLIGNTFEYSGPVSSDDTNQQSKILSFSAVCEQ